MCGDEGQERVNIVFVHGVRGGSFSGSGVCSWR